MIVCYNKLETKSYRFLLSKTNFASVDGKLFLGKLRMLVLIQDGNRSIDFVHIKEEQGQ